MYIYSCHLEFVCVFKSEAAQVCISLFNIKTALPALLTAAMHFIHHQ